MAWEIGAPLEIGTRSLGTWADLEAEAPAIAKIGSILLKQTGRAFLATIRANGGPRLHPLCPIIADGILFVGIIIKSPKYNDLLNDGRYILHAPLGPGDAEFWVEGRSRCIDKAESEILGARNHMLRMPPGNTLFELQLARAFATLFEPGPNDMPIPDRRCWQARTGCGAP
jgi:hypothetical protein